MNIWFTTLLTHTFIKKYLTKIFPQKYIMYTLYNVTNLCNIIKEQYIHSINYVYVLSLVNLAWKNTSS